MVGFSKVKNYYNFSPIHFFKLMGIVNSIPNDWKLIIKQSQQHVCPPSNDTIQINIESTAKATPKCFTMNLNSKNKWCLLLKTKKIKISRSFSGVERNLFSSIYRHTLYKNRSLRGHVLTSNKCYTINNC